MYPVAPGAAGIQGTVRIGISSDGTLSIIAGPRDLAAAALENLRQSKIFNPDVSDELRFVYKITEGDCT